MLFLLIFTTVVLYPFYAMSAGPFTKLSKGHSKRSDSFFDDKRYFSVPKFKSVSSVSNETILYNFSCTMDTYPVGGILQFYVNHRSTYTLRCNDNTCNKTNSSYTDAICSCSSNDHALIWNHRARKSTMLKRFDVEMTFVTFQLGRIKCSVTIVYNNTVILDTKTSLQSVEFPLNCWKNITGCDSSSSPKSHKLLTLLLPVVFLILILVLIVVWTLWKSFDRNGCPACCSFCKKRRHDEDTMCSDRMTYSNVQ